MRYIGIDPGYSGAIAYVDVNGTHETFDMPVFKEKIGGGKVRTRIDIPELCAIISDITRFEHLVFLEKQAPMPAQGVVSVFKLGVQYGLLQGVLSALGCSYQCQRSQAWQAEFSIIRSKDTKHASYNQASSLFPNATLKTPRGKILDGRCDALLMSEYLRRKFHT